MEKFSPLLQTILSKRGITSKEEADIFLNPDYERDLHNPFDMRDMEKACVRLFEAIDNKEKIVIYADYDCDGIPGAVILQDLFKRISFTNYEVYIPERNSEGYGLNMSALEEFRDKDVRLIITIDLGITAVQEVAQAKVYGIDVIVTDHHLPHSVLPKAFAILNPKIDDYKDKMLCGAGVVFKFVQGFLFKYRDFFKVKEGAEKWMLDMAGLATLSDMVPLQGENRAISFFGLKVLQKSPRLGLIKLLSKMKIDQKYLNEDDVGFMITPRINAASRMDSPMRAYELLSTEDIREASLLADHLTKINDDRKSIVTHIMREVNKTFEKKILNNELREVIVIGNPLWKVGVLGLVASKICDEYEKPVFVWGKDENDCIKGSCRSDGSVSLVELMTHSKASFLEFGGHELAGGFTAHQDKIHFLEESLSVSFREVKREIEDDEISFDAKLKLNDVNMRTWNDVEKLAPFGLANSKPVFLFENIQIGKIKKFGKNGSGEHLEITFTDTQSRSVKAVAFFSGLDSFKVSLNEGADVNLLATLELSRFGGKTELRLRIVDIY